MEFDLTPKFAQKLFEGDGGSYYSWSSSEFPLLRETKVGAGKLVLQPRGFALPHYADSSKIGYVLQGSDGVVGMVLPNTAEEVVLKLKKGDVVPVVLGSVSWWFNDGDSGLVIVFLGETSKSYIPGEFTYFILGGAQSIMGGFSPDFISRAYNVNKDDANKLAKSQTGFLIIKLQDGKRLAKPNKDNTNKLVYNINVAVPDIDVKHAGLVTSLTEAKFPFLGQVELIAKLVKLDAKAMSSPIYTTDSSVQLIYVVKGTCQVQIVGINGKQVLDTELKPGHLLVVPKFFVNAKVAGGDGLEYFSIITTSKPAFEDLSSKESAWGALSLGVVEASLNVSAEFGELFKSNIGKSKILIPPED
ncbi:glutelin type-B 2-like [Quercus robur]|uniref:glutelin type-B 2-like n=1 Tax=Quercus robur TaxID=38942 RepID=UPI00216110D0|nr:glutelin type-B 2-like [Quercus robur]